MKKDFPRIVVIGVLTLVFLILGIYIAVITEPRFQHQAIVSPTSKDDEGFFENDMEDTLLPEDQKKNVGPFVTQILNGEYDINGAESFEFHNGAYYFKYGPCKDKCEPLLNYPDSNYTVLIDQNNIATGDMDGDEREDAAVILGERYGGTGYFVSMAIFRNDNDRPVFVTLKDLGDRTLVQSIDIQDGLIFLHLLTHDSGEPMCCPTTPKLVIFELVEGTLLEKKE